MPMKEQTAFGREVITTVALAVKLLDGREHDSAQLHAIALHGTVIELLASCIAMADEDGASRGIPIVLRSMYEALVDLDNLLLNQDYFAYMEAAHLKQMCKLLQQADTNPRLQGLSERVDVSAPLAEFRARHADLKANGIEPLNIEDRSKRAGRHNEYLSLYGLFCMDSHNDLAALADRHFDGVAGAMTVSIFGEPYLPSVRQRLSHGIDFVLGTARMLHRASAATRLSCPTSSGVTRNCGRNGSRRMRSCARTEVGDCRVQEPATRTGCHRWTRYQWTRAFQAAIFFAFQRQCEFATARRVHR
jgi:hypothetical protein